MDAPKPAKNFASAPTWKMKYANANPIAAEAGEQEPGRHLAFRPPLGLRVDVRGAGEVLGKARVRDRVRDLFQGRALVRFVVAHALLPFDERVVWAVIQIANVTQAPRPTTQANSPSLTGPIEPR